MNAPAIHERLCPECGTPAGALPLRPPVWVRARSRLAMAALLLATLWVIWQSWQYRGPFFAAMPLPPLTHLTFPDVRVTLEDLERIASGERDGPSLASLLLVDSLTAANAELVVAFVPPAGLLTESYGYGWPLTWLSENTTAEMADVYDEPPRQHLTALAPWQRWAWHLERRRATSGLLESRIFKPLALLSLAALVLVPTWVAASSLLWLGRRRGWRCSPRDRRRVRAAALAIGLLFAFILAGVRDQSVHRILTGSNPAVAATGLTTRDILDLGAKRDPASADKALAAAILATDQARSASSTDVLAFGWQTGAGLWRVIERGRPVTLFYVAETELQDTMPLPQRWPTMVSIRHGFLIIDHSWVAPGNALAGLCVSLDLERLALLALVLVIGSWLSAAVVCRVWRLVHDRQLRRRLSLRECLSCGYPAESLRRQPESDHHDRG
jgi:hypothetical protein